MRFFFSEFRHLSYNIDFWSFIHAQEFPNFSISEIFKKIQWRHINGKNNHDAITLILWRLKASHIAPPPNESK